MAARAEPYRILIVDDNRCIHEDFKRALCQDHTQAAAAALSELEKTLFGDGVYDIEQLPPLYELSFAEQGDEAMEKLRVSHAAGKPFALAFLDIRMPPGWDGVETIQQLWTIDPQLQIGICSAYSDYTPEQLERAFAGHESVAVVRKPFDPQDIQNVALRLTQRWSLNRSKRSIPHKAA